MTTRFSVRLLDNLGTASELVQLARDAERAGFDAVWFPGDAFRLHSGAMLAATAHATETIGLGLRTNPYTSDPSEIAAYIATVDYLSAGRAILGVGLHTTRMLEWVGKADGDPVGYTRECIEVVDAVLRGEPGPHGHRFFKTTSDAFLRFAPYRPSVPTYVAAAGQEYLKMSGTIGDGSLPMVAPPEAASILVDDILSGARAVGRTADDVDIVGFVWLWLREDRAAPTDRLADVVAYFGEYLEDRLLATIGLSQEAFAPIGQRIRAGDREGARSLVTSDMLRLAIAGSPEECIEQIGRLVDAGVTHVSVGGPLGPDPREAIACIGQTIIPAFGEARA